MSRPPFFRADQVGSLLRPQRLLAARAQFEKGEIDRAALKAVEDDAIAEVVNKQESIGLPIVVDGEYRRENWWIDFIRSIKGVEIREGDARQAFVAPAASHVHGDGHAPDDACCDDHSWQYVPKNVYTVGKLGTSAPIERGDFEYLASVSHVAAKVTLPSPTRMHFHGGRAAVSKQAYPDEEQFFADIATIYQREIAALEEAGCRYIQIDDPLMTYFISDRLRAEVREAGDDPDVRLRRYIALTNECISRRSPETAIGVHVCRGNSRSGWIAEGGYERIAEAVFGGLKCDHLLLEYDDERSGDFAPLRHVPAGQKVVLGLVTTKRGELESVDTLKRRIDEASRIVPLENLALSPQCGFASTVEGNLISEEEQWAKLERVVDVARSVWGSTTAHA